MNTIRLQTNIENTTSLHCNKVIGTITPAKPLLLLAVVELFGLGEMDDNKILFSNERLATICQSLNRAYNPNPPTLIQYPFWHIQSEPFWRIVLQEERAMPSPKMTISAGWIRANVAYAELDQLLYESLCIAEERTEIRNAILKYYFIK